MAGHVYRQWRRGKDGKRRLASPFWWLCWQDATGRRQQESSKTDDKPTAKKLLRERLSAVDRHEPVTARTGKITVGEALKAVMEDKSLNGRRWLAEPKRMIEHHIEPHFGPKRRLASIGVADLRTYSRTRVEKGASPASVNRELSLLRRAFRLAQAANEITLVPAFAFLQEAAPRQGFCDPAQFAAVVKLLPSWLQPAVKAIYISGWRKNEIMRLVPQHVDLNANTLTLPPENSKTGEPRTIIMPTELRTIVEKQLVSFDRLKKRGYFPRFLFHKPLGTSIGSFRKRWRTAAKNAGHPGLLIHDLRRSATRNLTKAGVPEQTAMAVLGHKSNSTFRRYRIVDTSDLADAAAKLDAFLAQPQPKKKGAVVRPFTKRHAS